METETMKLSEFPNGDFSKMESHFRKNTIVRRKKQIQKSKTVGVRDPSRNVYQLSKVI